MRYFLCRAWYTSWETGGRLKHKKSNRHWAKLLASHESRLRLFAKNRLVSHRFSVWCRRGQIKRHTCAYHRTFLAAI